MEKRRLEPAAAFFWADFCVIVLSLIGTGALIHLETGEHLSFGGFGSLLILCLLIPYFGALLVMTALLLLSLKMKKQILRGIAFVLQIVCPIPWLLIWASVGPVVSLFEILMAIQIMLGVGGLLALLSCWRASR